MGVLPRGLDWGAWGESESERRFNFPETDVGQEGKAMMFLLWRNEPSYHPSDGDLHINVSKTSTGNSSYHNKWWEWKRISWWDWSFISQSIVGLIHPITRTYHSYFNSSLFIMRTSCAKVTKSTNTQSFFICTWLLVPMSTSETATTSEGRIKHTFGPKTLRGVFHFSAAPQWLYQFSASD